MGMDRRAARANGQGTRARNMRVGMRVEGVCAVAAVALSPPPSRSKQRCCAASLALLSREVSRSRGRVMRARVIRRFEGVLRGDQRDEKGCADMERERRKRTSIWFKFELN